ncbi:dynein axonemal assembly factor 11 [Centruroides vittatus]|uniref:dynein axonemal assembly factor 11 n=1 Tax=Centruroides vittatus TaxID=120091 RepID=UPI00350F7E96
MVGITEEMVRRRAEHNEGEIFNLEEISLHQENIERIENLDKWCRKLKILYLHNNVIPKIENVNRLKCLEYLNLTLNNILRIENLQGCESLEKLDLTLNFIGELTSIENLKNNYNLRELYLTGNPCTDYEGYREYVVATLLKLENLDGMSISKSERIQALQNYSNIRQKILRQQEQYFQNKTKSTTITSSEESSDDDDNEDEEKKSRFWNRSTEFTPESRLKIHKHIEKEKRRSVKIEENKNIKKCPPTLFNKNGRPLNINRAKLDFVLTDDEENNQFLLDLAVYKFLDTSLLDVDVQPFYVRVYVKQKVFQLCLPEEVFTSHSKVQRSQTTGHLLITMPKTKELLKKEKKAWNNEKKKEKYLEVTGRIIDDIDKIVSNHSKFSSEKILCGDDFTDDPDVPPLI